MDPPSIKRPRIMPPERRPQPQHALAKPAPVLADITSTLGLSAPRSLLSSQRDPYSNRHAKDTLFHKDTTHHRHLHQQQHQPVDHQKKYQQQLQLQQAHQEFHRQRELFQMQQQQQQQHPMLASPSSAPGSQAGPQQPLHHHHHHHHHHYHVHPLIQGTNTSSHPRSFPNQLRLTPPSVPTTSSPISTGPLSSGTGSSSSTGSSSTAPTPSALLSSARHHHHHHHHHPTSSSSLQQQLPQRPNQFSEWTTVKEKERARLLSNMARVRESQPALPSAQAAKENLKRLSQRLHQRRTRARETILFDLHQGVKTVEAQVHKQVDMVLSRLKDTPGSKYAFALSHTFLTQIPQALSNTILPSAISAVADTVAGKATNSLTTLRGAAGEEFDEDDEEEEDEDDLDDMDDMDELEYQRYQQRMLQRRSILGQTSGESSLSLSSMAGVVSPQQEQQLSSEFGTIALAASQPTSSAYSSSAETGPLTMAHSSRNYRNNNSRTRGGGGGRPVVISQSGASEFLAASTHHNYSTAASQVLSAALPSFIPSMVAPIVCVFSYPSPPASKPPTPNQSTPSSPSLLTTLTKSTVSSQPQQDTDTGTGKVSSIPTAAKSWTTAEREALFLAGTRFKLSGQWSKIREVMNLHRTDKEIETEYMRLYGDHDDDEDEEDDDDRPQATAPVDQDHDMQSVDEDSSAEKSPQNNRRRRMSGDETEDGEDADDEADAIVFMKFGGHARRSLTGSGSDCSDLTMKTALATTTATTRQSQPSRQYGLMDIQSLLSPAEEDDEMPVAGGGREEEESSASSEFHPPRSLSRQETLSSSHQTHPFQGGHSHVRSRTMASGDKGVPPMTTSHSRVSKQRRHRHDHHHLQYQHHGMDQEGALLKTLNEKPLRVVKKEFMIDKRFALEEIPMRL